MHLVQHPVIAAHAESTYWLFDSHKQNVTMRTDLIVRIVYQEDKQRVVCYSFEYPFVLFLTFGKKKVSD